MIKEFKILNKKISCDGRTFIIAEIGINHGGNFARCKKMIIKAKKAGADAVKLQTINHNESYMKTTKSYTTFKGKNFSDRQLSQLIKIAKKNKIIFFTTPGDISSLIRIKKLNIPAIKISSGLFTNLPLIEEACKLNRPIILSCGLAYYEEIKSVIKLIRRKTNKFALLKCTSLYPAPDETLNLNTISKLKNEFKIPIGYSDHTKDFLASITAVSKGATILEKHFTLNKKIRGADHHLSLEPNEFKEYVQTIRRCEKMKGDKNKFPSDKEISQRRTFHRYLVSNIKLKKGNRLKLKHLNFMRLSKNKNGILAFNYKKVLNKKIKKNLNKNQIVSNKIINLK